jgi:hypothetical protein
MRCASRLRCPWLAMGSAPPVDSITISDQSMPVEMCTEAIFDMAMLSSFAPNSRDLIRITRSGLMTSLVGKRKFPCVKRLAVKVSDEEESGGLGAAANRSNPDVAQSQLPNYKMTQLQNFYTHSSAPFFHTQTYPAIRITRKINISTSPNSPKALNFTAQGNRKIVSTSNTTNRIAMM